MGVKGPRMPKRGGMMGFCGNVTAMHLVCGGGYLKLRML